MKKTLLITSLALFLTSCTENQRVKSFGGKSTLKLNKGEQLDMVTWKNDELWLLTSKRPDSVSPKTYTFKEKSSFGVIEGAYIIKEE